LEGALLKKWSKRLQKLAVHELLDSFISNERPKKVVEKSDQTDRQLFHEVLRQDVMRQYRKITTEISEARKKTAPENLILSYSKESDKPIVSKKLRPVKSCQNCYFCVDSKRLGSIVWCKCSNTLRVSEAGSGVWIPSKINLDCWTCNE
jgi:hypothetical protein